MLNNKAIIIDKKEIEKARQTERKKVVWGSGKVRKFP
jgi:hypothetical protein